MEYVNDDVLFFLVISLRFLEILKLGMRRMCLGVVEEDN